jgi:hypothetical protein
MPNRTIITMVITINTITTDGTTQGQGAVLGSTYRETTTPKSSGLKEETGSTGTVTMMTGAMMTGATMTATDTIDLTHSHLQRALKKEQENNLCGAKPSSRHFT